MTALTYADKQCNKLICHKTAQTQKYAWTEEHMRNLCAPRKMSEIFEVSSKPIYRIVTELVNHGPDAKETILTIIEIEGKFTSRIFNIS